MKSLKEERLFTEHYNKSGELFKVIEYKDSNHVTVEFQDEYKGTKEVQWQAILNKEVKNPNELSTGIIRRDSKFKDLTGKKFGRLTVLKISDIYNKGKHIKWVCQCSCENQTIIEVDGRSLRSGHTKSCGCLVSETSSKIGKKSLNKKKYNNLYDLSGEFGIGYCINTNNPFYFDLEDYELISKYAWYEHNNYVETSTSQCGDRISMHRLLLNVTDSKIEVDHIGHNKMDNRKSKLRISKNGGNHQNLLLASNNTSGVTGVCWEEESQKWHSYIWHKDKCIHLGRFADKDEAIKIRKKAEDKYFGEYSYDNSMKIYEDKNEL